MRTQPRSHGALMARMIADYERQRRRELLRQYATEAAVIVFLLVVVVGGLYALGPR